MSPGTVEETPAMGSLIPMINKLQDVFNLLGADSRIDLPQIVVVGSQSAGKSSVLESICQRDFLPRGSGIVTRRPLVLQLNHINEQPKGQPQEWGEFLHKPGQKISDFDAICKEIEAETAAVAGAGQCVSKNPIRLKLFSPYVLNLTLVDLPGIARNPVGDQPKNIEFLIKDMVMEYISKPNALILAVTAANTDLATSDAIALAASVDPSGDRTIGVLTKLDLMDKGTDAYRILTNREHPLKLGWTGVVNRSQADIDHRTAIAKAQENERNFFLTHPRYRDIADSQGTSVLALKLNKILIQHIQRTIPSLSAKLGEMLDRTSAELATYGTSVPESQKPGLVLQLISQYVSDYNDIIDGKSQLGATDYLVGGARIAYIFNETFTKMLDVLDPTTTISMDEIRTMVRNAAGPRMLLFIPMRVLELLAQRVVKSLEKPCQRCLDLVLHELITFTRQVSTPALQRYNTLNSRILSTAEKILNALAQPCHRYIHETIMCEVAFINANHPDFKSAVMKQMAASGQAALMPPGQSGVGQALSSGAGQMPPPPPAHNPFLAIGALSPSGVDSFKMDPTHVQELPDSIKVNGPWSENEKAICDMIPRLLLKYFQIVRKKIQDTIPKCVMYFLVGASQEHLQSELVSKLYVPGRINALLDEDPEISRKREAALEMLKMLQKAQAILKDVGTV